jgi:hypothetical protein
MATLKQLAIALNMDFKSMKAKFLADAQSSDNFEFADEISKWEPSSDIPQPLVELAQQAGLNVSRKRKPSAGVGGGLANPSEVVASYLGMLPNLLANAYKNEQDAFISESKFAGKMTGAAGALAFQNSLVTTFAELNDSFRQARLNGMEKMQTGVTGEFNDLFSGLCDADRLLEASKASVELQTQQFSDILDKMDALLTSSGSDTQPTTETDELGK